MSRPRLLDLFCCAGGAAKGYQRAGWHVTGVDIEPQPHYCGDAFIQSDWAEVDLHGYDAIHASPVCLLWSTMRALTDRCGNSRPGVNLIPPVRDALLRTGLPFIIENVPRAPLANPLTLCGTMFNLQVSRHRCFELHGFALSELLPGRCHCRNGTTDGRIVAFRGGKGASGRYPLRSAESDFRAEMGCDWMPTRKSRQAIPPAYTEWLGRQILR